MIAKVFEIWRGTSDRRFFRPDGAPDPIPGATQMVFSDLGTPSVAEARGFSAYLWARDELRRRQILLPLTFRARDRSPCSDRPSRPGGRGRAPAGIDRRRPAALAPREAVDAARGQFSHDKSLLSDVYVPTPCSHARRWPSQEFHGTHRHCVARELRAFSTVLAVRGQEALGCQVSAVEAARQHVQEKAADELGRVERHGLEPGYAWNGRVYRSLSQVAKAITGTHWNGHRFFAVRDRASNTKSSATAKTELIARYWHVANPRRFRARNARSFDASRRPRWVGTRVLARADPMGLGRPRRLVAEAESFAHAEADSFVAMFLPLGHCGSGHIVVGACSSLSEPIEAAPALRAWTEVPLPASQQTPAPRAGGAGQALCSVLLSFELWLMARAKQIPPEAVRQDAAMRVEGLAAILC